MGDGAEKVEHVLEGGRIVLEFVLELCMLIARLGSSMHINRVDVPFMEGVHMAIGKKAIWKEGKQDKLRKGEEFISR